MLLSACGSQSEQNVGEPHHSFTVKVTSSFPAHQRLAQQTEMVVSVKNTSNRTMPDVAVTVTNPRYGDAAQSFGLLIPKPGTGQPLLASRSRPIWIINRAPGACGYSCKALGPGGAATAYTDTWALGALPPGKTATFEWHLTAIQAGTFKTPLEANQVKLHLGLAYLNSGQKPKAKDALKSVTGADGTADLAQLWITQAGL